ncbi:M56 family metallopeptidase [Akkermansiaceae bacterium]|nr:M56 family metallopeptidase [Akkermansiaceae bacterium]
MNSFNSHPDLLLSLAKFTSALLIALAVAPLLKRPALRSTFWAAIFLILPAMILASHGRSLLNILPRFPAVAEIEITQAPTPIREAVAAPAIPSAMPAGPIESIDARDPARRVDWVSVVFSAGLIVSLLPILISILRIRFIPKKPAYGVTLEEWLTIRPQKPHPAPLYLTRSPAAPFTAGFIRESVLLPESAAGWSMRRLRSTLHHEAAHISRRDPLVRMFASLVRAALWFHPLIWLAHRQLVAAQEEACDEIALAAGIPADEYAEDLLETARCSQGILGHSLGMARWSQLGSRIRFILDKSATQTKPLTMKTKAIVSLGIAAATFGLSSLGFSEAPDAAARIPDAAAKPGQAGIEAKLNRIVMPRIDFEDVTLGDAIEYLRIRSAELDVAEKDPARKGFNFVIQGAPGAKDDDDPESRRIPELRLRNVPIGVVLDYICNATRMAYKVDEFAIAIRPLGNAEGADAAKPANGPGAAIIARKLEQIVIPAMHFDNITIEEAIDFLRLRSLELDVAEKDPAKRGFNFVIRKPLPANKEGDGAAAGDVPRIAELHLRNVPFGATLKYVCDAAKMDYKIDEFAVTIIPRAD